MPRETSACFLCVEGALSVERQRNSVRFEDFASRLNVRSCYTPGIDTASPPSPEVRMLALAHLRGDADALTLEWADGAVHRVTWRELRDRCPCATCAQSHVKPNTPASLDLLPVLSLAETQPLRALWMRPLGNYAYAIQFTDGHNTGIYSLDYLRTLGQEIASRP